jgi:putative ABC transport system permease protein
MLASYLKIALRHLLRQKLYTGINIAGLALGIACFILIFLYIRNEWTYDMFHENADRMYRVNTVVALPTGELQTRSNTPAPLAAVLRETFPEMAQTVRLQTSTAAVHLEDQPVEDRVLFADSTLFEMMTFPMIAGHPDKALNGPSSLVLTASAAKRYFGQQNPIGQRLILEYTSGIKEYTITGIVQDVPGNSSIQFDMIVPFEHCVHNTISFFQTRLLTAWDLPGFDTFVLLADGADAAVLEIKLASLISVHWGEKSNVRQLKLQPVADLRHDTSVKGGYATRDPLHGYILMGIAFTVLLLACINYTTLAIGRSMGRAREVGIRKVTGAHRGQLMRQFWGEALLITALAFVLGMALAELLLPVFNRLAQTTLAIDAAAFDMLLAFAGLILLVGLIAGSYPAVLLSRFQPTAVLKGRLTSGAGRSLLMRSLIALQFTMAIALLVCALIMGQQLTFMQARDLGFDQDLLVMIEGPKRGDMNPIFRRFLKEAKSYHTVKRMATSSIVFGRQSPSMFYVTSAGDRIPVLLGEAGEDYLETMSIELVQGESFPKGLIAERVGSPVLVNETFVRALGDEFRMEKDIQLDSGSGFRVFGMKVVGVIKDFHYRSLHYPIEPLILALRSDDQMYLGGVVVLARIAPQDVQGTIRHFEKTWQRVAPGHPFLFSFVDELVQTQYAEDERENAIVRYTAILALLITCIGLFGLVTLATAQRIKEIGIRKVLGASVANIVALHAKEFTLLVLLANLLAWPLAYLAMSRWLGHFAYRIEMGPEVFLLGGAATMLLAWLTLSYQTIRAGRMNPVEALRYE